MFNILIVDNFHQVFSGPILVMYGLLFGPKFAMFKATPTEVGNTSLPCLKLRQQRQDNTSLPCLKLHHAAEVGQYKFAMFKATPAEVGQYKFAMFKATPAEVGTIQAFHHVAQFFHYYAQFFPSFCLIFSIIICLVFSLFMLSFSLIMLIFLNHYDKFFPNVVSIIHHYAYFSSLCSVLSIIILFFHHCVQFFPSLCLVFCTVTSGSLNVFSPFLMGQKYDINKFLVLTVYICCKVFKSLLKCFRPAYTLCNADPDQRPHWAPFGSESRR